MEIISSPPPPSTGIPQTDLQMPQPIPDGHYMEVI